MAKNGALNEAVTPFLLEGEWVAGAETAEVRSPYSGELIANVAQASAGQMEQAIAAAQRAQAEASALTPEERGSVLRKVATDIKERSEEFALLICREAGKPIKAARAEVTRAVFTFGIAAEEALRPVEEVLPPHPLSPVAGYSAKMRKFPLGPIAAITPFNFPLNLVAHKLAPAMAVGCPVVLKPAPQTPLTAFLLAKAIIKAGWPAAALHVLPASNEVAARMVTDDRLKMLSFTGSAEVGWKLKAMSGKKRVVLELGGNAAAIVHDDADVADAAARCVTGGFSYAGQSCISVQRIFAQQNIFEEFLARVLELVGGLQVGDPMKDSTDVGPLIRESDAVRIAEWIEESVAGGARLLTGGKRAGSFVSPAVLTGTRREDRVNREEAFAPLVVIERYRTFEEAVARANDSRYGLQAGVFTQSAERIEYAFRALEVGGVLIGEAPTFRSDHLPYGGVKDSGMGREGVRYAMEEMRETKVLITRART